METRDIWAITTLASIVVMLICIIGMIVAKPGIVKANEPLWDDGTNPYVYEGIQIIPKNVDRSDPECYIELSGVVMIFGGETAEVRMDCNGNIVDRSSHISSATWDADGSGSWEVTSSRQLNYYRFQYDNPSIFAKGNFFGVCCLMFLPLAVSVIALNKIGRGAEYVVVETEQ